MSRSLERSPEIRSKGAAPGKRDPRVEAVSGASFEMQHLRSKPTNAVDTEWR